MRDSKLEKEFQYFKNNQGELVGKHKDKFLVIKDRKVQDVYDSEAEAYDDAKDKFELGSFLIQQALPGEESYTQTLYSRVTLS